MKTSLTSSSRRATRRTVRSKSTRAFSLVEMLVALAVFMVLLAAVFIPIKMAGDLSSVGTSRANAQQSAVDGIRRIKTDIQRAIFILPNAPIIGVTDQAPYYPDNGHFPYLRDPAGYILPTTATASDGRNQLNACRTSPNAVVPAANTSRLDMILPNEDEGTVNANLKPGNVLVSYYCRRRDMTQAFDPVNNPVVLYRAQIPFRVSVLDSTSQIYRTKAFPAWDNSAAFNADVSVNRFANRSSSCTANVSRGLQWLTMNQYGEFDLAPICLPPTGTATTTATDPNAPPTFGSHTLVLPRDTALLTPYGDTDTQAAPVRNTSLVPDTTFILSANSSGKIDTIKIQLSVGQYDQNSVSRRDTNTGTGPRSAIQPQVARTVSEIVRAINVN